MRSLLATVILFIIALASVADLPFNSPRPQWSDGGGSNAASHLADHAAQFSAPGEAHIAIAGEDGSLWYSRRVLPVLLKLDREGNVQAVPYDDERIRQSFPDDHNSVTVTTQVLAKPFHPFRSGERPEYKSVEQTFEADSEPPTPHYIQLYRFPGRVKQLFAIILLDDAHPLLILQMLDGRVVSATLGSEGHVTLFEEIASADEMVIIHASVTAQDHDTFLLGERLGSAYLARLGPLGKLEWRRQMVWGNAAAGTKSRLLDGFSLADGGVQVLGELRAGKAAPQVRVVQINKSGEAGREKSFPGRPIAMAGGSGRNGVALYESAGPGPAMTLLSLDESLTERWRMPLPIPGRAVNGDIQLKAVGKDGMLAAAAIDGRLWAIRFDGRGEMMWDYRPDYQAYSVKIIAAPSGGFFLLSTVVVEKFAESD